MKILTKLDSKNCKAQLIALRVFINNDSRDYWAGKVNYIENSIRLFSEKSVIVRPNYDDALKDAENLAKQNGF